MKDKINGYMKYYFILVIIVALLPIMYGVNSYILKPYNGNRPGQYFSMLRSLFNGLFMLTLLLALCMGFEPLHPNFNNEKYINVFSQITKNRDLVFIMYLILFIIINKIVPFLISDYNNLILEYTLGKYQKSLYDFISKLCRLIPNLYMIPHILLFYFKCE